MEFEALYQRLMDSLEMHRDLSDAQILASIDSILSGSSCRVRLADRGRIRKELFNAVRRLDVLQELIDDDRITEIMVNGTEGIYYEQDGVLRRWNKNVSSREKLEDIVRQIASACNRVVNESSPIVDARLRNGARVNVVMQPVAVDGPVITDSLSMESVRERDEPGGTALAALRAGCDMLLMPADLPAAYEAVLSAVESGEISESRLDESVRRILRCKASAGLI